MDEKKSVEEMLDQTELTFGDTAGLKHPTNQLSQTLIKTPTCIRFILADGTRLDATARPFITLGRRDKKNTEVVDLDFANHGGRDNGVSRRHAVISVRNSSVLIKDYNSSNGTLLNGNKLYPMREYTLNDSDDVILGRISAKVKFIY